ncbi:MAG TPA: DUF4124 domain-containing protein [Halothiobacillus sp.]|nr:DUF4124 domain-containing protein [Halothiobacillus sp.]
MFFARKCFKDARLVRQVVLPFMLVGALLMPVLAEAELYRWTTPDGQIHFGDNMPSSQAERGYDIINPATGVVTRHINRAKTPDELAAEAAAEQKRQEEAKAAADQARKDQVLLQLYSNKADIERARAQRMAEVNAQITQLKNALNRAELRGRSEKPSEVAAAAHDVEQLRKNLADLYGVRDDVVRQFDHDLRRFDELTKHKPAVADR